MTRIEINLTAVIMGAGADQPLVYASSATQDPTSTEGGFCLPSGPFDPAHHRTLELGLRNFARDQAGLSLGYVEQLYTFGDRGRTQSSGMHEISIGYLALTRAPAGATNFRPLYQWFPWEDWRKGKPAVLDAFLLPALHAWSQEPPLDHERGELSRKDRVSLHFGAPSVPFDEEKVLERYELLYEAGLVAEAIRDRQLSPRAEPVCGQAMQFDHRRILATALGRIRGKLKYRPLIFEIMPDAFTLTDLQRKVEAISGQHLHKQNFRRLVETGGLVEATGEQTTTGGRPAALFRFRRDVLTERPAPGLRLGRAG
jgi:hypothetical protein